VAVWVAALPVDPRLALLAMDNSSISDAGTSLPNLISTLFRLVPAYHTINPFATDELLAIGQHVELVLPFVPGIDWRLWVSRSAVCPLNFRTGTTWLARCHD
jgi:hypothetical protein